MPASKTRKPRKSAYEKKEDQLAALRRWEYEAGFSTSKRSLVARIKILQKKIEDFSAFGPYTMTYEELHAIYTGAFACAETRGLIVEQSDGSYKWDYENGR